MCGFGFLVTVWVEAFSSNAVSVAGATTAAGHFLCAVVMHSIIVILNVGVAAWLTYRRGKHFANKEV